MLRFWRRAPVCILAQGGYLSARWPAHQPAMFLGFDWSTLKPEWAIGGLAQCWPLFIMTLIMLGALVAMTLCDARTYMIPLQLAWTPGVVGVLAHSGWGIWLHLKQAKLAALPDRVACGE